MSRFTPSPPRATALTWAAFLAASLAIGMESRALGAGSLTIAPGGSLSLTGFNQSNFLLNNSGSLFTTAGAGANTCFSGVLNNEGQVSLVHPFTLIGNVTLNGSGTMTLSGGTLTSAGAQQLFNASLITGSGVIGDSANLKLINSGTISATTGSLTIKAPQNATDAFINNGLVLADGGKITYTGGTLQNGGALIEARANSTVSIMGPATVIGGTLRNVLGGQFTILGGILSDVTLQGSITLSSPTNRLSGVITSAGIVNAVGGFTLNGTIQNSGTIALSGNGAVTQAADAALTGGGTIQLKGGGWGSTGSARTLFTDNVIIGDGTLTGLKIINAGTISQTSSFSKLTLSLVGATDSFTNLGAIVASGGFLSISGFSSATVSNTGGLIQASSGGTLSLGFNLSSGPAVVGGTLRADHAALFLNSASIISPQALEAVNGGTITSAGTITGGTLALTPGSTFIPAAGGSTPVLNNLTLAGGGGFPSAKFTGSLTIAGNFTIAANASTANGISIPTLLLAGDTTGSFTSRLDITSNKLAVGTGVVGNKTTELTSLRAALNAGVNNGDWQGMGITSSTVAADQSSTGSHLTALALYDNAVLNLTTFGGQPVDTNSLLVTTALIGDANFDSVVDTADYTTVSSHWQQTASDWTSGDLNYDGIVDLLDAVLVATHQSPPNTPALGLTAPPLTVPEPAALLSALLLSPLFLSRHRRFQPRRKDVPITDLQS